MTKIELIEKLETAYGCLIGSHIHNYTPQQQFERIINELKQGQELPIPDVSITKEELCEICGCNDATITTKHCQTCDEYIINGEHN